MSDPKHQIPDLSKTSFTTWKQKILGHCQQLGLKKYLTTNVVPTTQLTPETIETNRSKTAGILLSFMGTTNYNRFVTEENEEDPVKLWKLLTDHYEAKTSGNHAKVYNDFITLQFKGTDLTTYLESIDEHLKIMSSVGMKFVGADCDVKESLIAENIVLKLPEKYASTKEFLYSKRPLTIELVKETLNNKRRDVSLNSVSVKTEDTAMTATKSNTKKREYCSGGKHNPKSTHSEKDCWQLTKRTANAAHTNDSDDAGSRASSAGFRCAMAASSNPGLSYLDSGASHHMFADKRYFKDYRPRKTTVEIADGNTLAVEGDGFVWVNTDSKKLIKLKAIHVPKLSTTLISLGRLLQKGCEIKHTGRSSFNIIHEDVVFFKAVVIAGTCMIRISPSLEGQFNAFSSPVAYSATDVQLLHRRAGHCGNEALKRIKASS
ncbi:hypothetical protein VP01_1367g7 [Puccinia sorghi]|uniref:Retrovirus-related Pol polyprotein from transposon TNT 1-94-like beta-barrel domain-containing protein n=1 Tax=Puccinia sorghi TaxID=27349 RepID=A0A0L6VLS3_9BASI|nr:hypothetical protein VP01_1367g7 [Puccinia sorghi]